MMVYTCYESDIPGGNPAHSLNNEGLPLILFSPLTNHAPGITFPKQKANGESKLHGPSYCSKGDMQWWYHSIKSSLCVFI